LDISGAITTVSNFTIDSAATAQIEADGASGAHALVKFSQAGTQTGVVGYSNGDSTIKLYSGTDGIASATNGISINASGHVGIGQNVPESRLHIEAASSGTSVSADGSDIFIVENDDSAAIDIRTPNDASGGILFSDPQARARAGVIYYHGTDQMNFSTAGTNPQMVINQAGNVGFKVTPETATASETVVQIGGNALIQSTTSQGANGSCAITHNAYVNSGWKYISADQASYISMGDGTIQLSVAVAGSSARDPITWKSGLNVNNSGNVGIAGVAASAQFHVHGDMDNTGSYGIRVEAASSDGSNIGYMMAFIDEDDAIVGSVTTDSSGNSTAFNTSSDYRLKENEVAISDGITRLNQLKPYRFNWKKNPDYIVDGFFAHEVKDIVPQSIVGEKDAVRDEEYEVSPTIGEVFTPAIEEVTTEQQATETVETGSYVNLAGETITETKEVGVTEEVTKTVVERQEIDGVITEVEVEKVTQEPVMETVVTTEAVAEVILESDVERPEEPTEGQQWRETTAKVMGTRSVPDYQGIDQSKLVPLLVAAVKELSAKVTALENA